jgi:ribosomal protein L6P/L9E
LEEEANSSVFEYEVTVQPELLNAVLEKMVKENNEYGDCQMELSTESNDIIITGQSKEDVQKCVARIRTIRNELMKSGETVPKTAEAIQGIANFASSNFALLEGFML